MKELLLYIDPNFDETNPLARGFVSSVHQAAINRRVDVWHYVGNHVSKETVRQLGLERFFYISLANDMIDPQSFARSSQLSLYTISLFKKLLNPARALVKKYQIRFPIAYPARLDQDSIVKGYEETNLACFSILLRQLCNRLIAKASDDWNISLFIYDCPPVYLPTIAKTLRMKKYKNIFVSIHVCLGSYQQLVQEMNTSDCNDVMNTISAHLEYDDRAKRIKLYTASNDDAKQYTGYFQRSIRTLQSSRFEKIGTQPNSDYGKKILDMLDVGVHSEKKFSSHGKRPLLRSSKVNTRGKEIPDTNLERFKNIHRGQRCFIVGNGPSLNKMDLSKLEGEYVFCTNAFFLMFPRIKWRPQYYTAVDTRVIPDRAKDIIAMHEKHPDMTLFLPSALVDHQTKETTPTESIIPPARNRFYFTQRYPHDDHLPYSAFSLEADKYLIQPYTVTITALQLAIYLGFDPIYLIGCDTEYAIPSSVMSEGEETKFGKMFLTSTEDDDINHFVRDYFGKGRTWHNPQVENMIWHYKMAHEASAIYGCHIYNATVGGKLEVFPRVNFDEVVR